MPELLRRSDVERSAKLVARKISKRNSTLLQNHKIAIEVLSAALLAALVAAKPQTWLPESTSEFPRDKLVLQRWNVCINTTEPVEIGEFQQGAIVRLRSNNAEGLIALLKTGNGFKGTRLSQGCLRKEGAYIIFDSKTKLFLKGGSHCLLVMDLMDMSPGEAETFVQSQGGQAHKF